MVCYRIPAQCSRAQSIGDPRGSNFHAEQCDRTKSKLGEIVFVKYLIRCVLIEHMYV